MYFSNIIFGKQCSIIPFYPNENFGYGPDANNRYQNVTNLTYCYLLDIPLKQYSSGLTLNGTGFPRHL